jgi:aldehyde:ferredoxin oxidoreductase
MDFAYELLDVLPLFIFKNVNDQSCKTGEGNKIKPQFSSVKQSCQLCAMGCVKHVRKKTTSMIILEAYKKRYRGIRPFDG